MSLARVFLVELQPRGMQVNVLTPGPIATPQELAKARLFLASDDSSYKVGNELVVSGDMNFKAY